MMLRYKKYTSGGRLVLEAVTQTLLQQVPERVKLQKKKKKKSSKSIREFYSTSKRSRSIRANVFVANLPPKQAVTLLYCLAW